KYLNKSGLACSIVSYQSQGSYPQIFFKSVEILIKKGILGKKGQKVFEKSVVRPWFTDRGQVAISEAALSQMVTHCVKEFDSRLDVQRIKVERKKINIYSLEVVLEVPYGIQLAGTMHNLQKYILESIEKYAGLELDKVNVTVGDMEKPESK
ncbi:MAG: Asp23/Gls24 family envelope stress response protein, partial [Spirochaetota bacterium]